MTVGELIKLLRQFEDDVEVRFEGVSFDGVRFEREVEIVNDDVKVIDESVYLY